MSSVAPCDVLLIDGDNMARRAWERAKTDDSPMQRMYELMVGMALTVHKPRYAAVAYDDTTCFRRAVYPEYKAGRAEKTEALASWLASLRAADRVCGVPGVMAPDHEADDVLATLAAQAAGSPLDLQTVVLTTDRDAFAMVGPRVRMARPARSGGYSYVDEAAVCATLDIPSVGYVPAYKALVGDAGDNVPGVRHIGPKTASRLLQESRTHAEVAARLRQTIKDGAYGADTEALRELRVVQYRLSLKTVKLRTDAPVTRPLSACELRPRGGGDQ
jgi:5'-3' exonuclease